MNSIEIANRTNHDECLYSWLKDLTQFNSKIELRRRIMKIDNQQKAKFYCILHLYKDPLDNKINPKCYFSFIDHKNHAAIIQEI